MPTGHIAIEARSRNYWASELKKYRAACVASTVGLMESNQRQFFIRKKIKLNSGAKEFATKNDVFAAQLLIEQAIFTLERNGFDGDEIACLREWMQSGAPKGAPGERPVPVVDKLAARHLYDRMTGQALQRERSQRHNTLPAWQIRHNGRPLMPDVLQDAISPLTSVAQQSIESDKKHRLNTREAMKLLRELLKLSQTTLRRTLRSASAKK